MLNNKLDTKMYTNGMSKSVNGHHHHHHHHHHHQNGGHSKTDTTANHSNHVNGHHLNGNSHTTNGTNHSTNGHHANQNGTSKHTSTSSTNAKEPVTNGSSTSNQLVCAEPNSQNSLVAATQALMLTNVNGLYKVFSTESVLNLLCCSFCQKPYRDPRLLHCGHTYCLPCLMQMNRYSTIRCIKCNSLQTVTSHAVETLPKNLFVADIQCIPTVEIDRGAAYKETLKSLEDLKLKLLDFSDKFDQSETKLYQVSDMKKREVSEQISKCIEQMRLLEEEFHNEIDEFRNNRLSVLRSAPPEFKETNANLLQFVNQSLGDLMRPDIKEEDVKEIYNRCEEHRRLWNETEIIFNSNYAIGEIYFQPNETTLQKENVGAIVQKFPQKLYAQRTAKGPINISFCCPDGNYILLENTSKRNDVNMANWVLSHCVGSVRKTSFKFPDNFVVKSKQCVKLWASSVNTKCARTNSTSSDALATKQHLLSNSNGLRSTSNGKSLNGLTSSKTNGSSTHVSNANGETSEYDETSMTTMTTTTTPENELVIDEIENWTCGNQEILIRLENEFGEEKASFRKSQ